MSHYFSFRQRRKGQKKGAEQQEVNKQETWPLVLGPGKPNPALHLHSNNTNPAVYWCQAGHTESEEKETKQKQNVRKAAENRSR